MAFSWTKKGNQMKGNAAYYKLKDGENLFRLFTFKHKVTEGDFQLRRYAKGEVAIGDMVDEAFIGHRKHFKPQITRCGLLPCRDGSNIGECELCDEAYAIIENPDASKTDKEAAKRLTSSLQFDWVVVPLNEGEEMKFVTISLSKTISQAILEAENFAQKKGKSVFGFDGRDLRITVDKNARAFTERNKVSFVDSADSTVIKPSSLQGKAPDLFAIPSYLPTEFQHLIGEGQEAAKNDAGEATPVETTKKTTKSKKTQQAQSWPPEKGQKVKVRYEDGSTGDAEVSDFDKDSGLYTVLIDGDEQQCELGDLVKPE